MRGLLLFVITAIFSLNAGAMELGIDDFTDGEKRKYDLRITSRALTFLQPLNGLLQDYVKSTRHEDGNLVYTTTLVDYAGWQKDDRHKLAMAKLLKADLDGLSNREEKLSFWINTYNLLVIDLILKQKEPVSIDRIGGLVGDPWRQFFWDVGGKRINLHTIKEKQLKPLREPRFHFTIVGACVSCPDLKPSVYWPVKIYSQMEDQAKNFLTNPNKGFKRTYAPNGKGEDTVNVSMIFKRDKTDFAQGKLKVYLARYHLMENVRMGPFLPFDWALNAQEGKAPRKK